MTLLLDSTSTKKLSLLKELALQLGVKVVEMPQTIIKKPNKQEETRVLSKTINKAMTKKLFAKLDIDYDSYNRQ